MPKIKAKGIVRNKAANFIMLSMRSLSDIAAEKHNTIKDHPSAPTIKPVGFSITI